MIKFCIFCGKRPSDKTKEHIIPQWLLKMTGKPNRKAYFGRDWLSPNLDERVYSWQAFTFPACDVCNGEWSALEDKVKPILTSMLNAGQISAVDFQILLNWLDKVRVGLWLGMICLNKNYRGLIPQFHINNRVAQKDRALLIFESSDPVVGIGLGGCDTAIFHHSPSILHLSINHLHFVTMSCDFFLSERLGWPFVINKKFRDIDTDGFDAEFSDGKGAITSPVIDDFPPIEGSSIMQAIAPQDFYRGNPQEFEKYYFNQFIKDASLGENIGTSKVLFNHLAPIAYPEIPSFAWNPSFKYPHDILLAVLGACVVSMQKRVFLEGTPDFSHFPESDRKAREREIRGIIVLQDLVIKHIENGGR